MNSNHPQAFSLLISSLVISNLPFSPVFEIMDNGAYVVNDNELLFLPADTVVMAVCAKSENKLLEEL
jgi:hypothetical protein